MVALFFLESGVRLVLNTPPSAGVFWRDWTRDRWLPLVVSSNVADPIVQIREIQNAFLSVAHAFFASQVWIWGVFQSSPWFGVVCSDANLRISSHNHRHGLKGKNSLRLILVLLSVICLLVPKVMRLVDL